MAVFETPIFINEPIEKIAERLQGKFTLFRIELDDEVAYLADGDNTDIAIFGLLAELRSTDEWTRLLHPLPEDPLQLAKTLLQLGVSPENLMAMTDWDDNPLMDLAAIRLAMIPQKTELRQKKVAAAESKRALRAYPAKLPAQQHWTVIDAEGLVVGRVASIIASRLRGKHLPTFTPHMDMGDNVVVINADKVKFTGRKLDQHKFYWHTGFAGGIKDRTAREILEGRFPERVLENAVRRMMPSGPLTRAQLKNLRVYAGSNLEEATNQLHQSDYVEVINPHGNLVSRLQKMTSARITASSHPPRAAAKGGKSAS